jgi:hypothetical protein
MLLSGDMLDFLFRAVICCGQKLLVSSFVLAAIVIDRCDKLIQNHVLPTADEAESIWTKFGFIRPRWGTSFSHILFGVWEIKEVEINMYIFLVLHLNKKKKHYHMVILCWIGVAGLPIYSSDMGMSFVEETVAM